MRGIVLKVYCGAACVLCCMGDAWGMEEAGSEQLTRMNAGWSVQKIIKLKGCQPRSQQSMASQVPADVQNTIPNVMNSINASGVNMDRLIQSLLARNQQLDRSICLDLTTLQTRVSSITEVCVPKLNRILRENGIAAYMRSDFVTDAANSRVNIKGALGLFRQYLDGMQAGLDRINGMVQFLPQEIHTAIRDNSADIQQHIGFMNHHLIALKQSIDQQQARSVAQQQSAVTEQRTEVFTSPR